MHRYVKKYSYILLTLIILLQCIVISGWGRQKEGMHTDEMFTLEGSKQGGRSMRYWDHLEGFFNAEHTREEFAEWITTYPEDLLVNLGIDEVIDALVNRDCYYTLVNLAATLFPGVFTYWIGVGINMFLFVVAQILLYNIGKRLGGEACALTAVAVYGFSAGAISTVLYIRCYMMIVVLLLATIVLYMEFANMKKSGQRIFGLIGFYILLVVSYQVHQFGVILFAITTVFFLFYFIMKGDWRSLIWIGGGYGLPAILGWRIVYNSICGLIGGGAIGQLFWAVFRGSKLKDFLYREIQLLIISGRHLLADKWMVCLLGSGYLILFFVILKKYKAKEIILIKENLLAVVVFFIAGIYNMILLMGGASAWRYISPIYPLIILLLTLLWFKAAEKLKNAQLVMSLFIGIFVVITLVSYKEVRVSELYIGTKALRAEVEKRYNGWNGIMVHHGLSENWLYEAATLWPEDSHVLLVKNEVLHDRELCYNRPDEKILLWLTIDYDNDEVIEELKECTDYKDVELAFTTDSLLVYECTK